MAKVTLSVVSHEQHSLVDALLADIAGIGAPELARIVITQNLGEPPPATRGLRLPPVQVVHNSRPRGFGANHNSAFAYCDTEFFAVVNPDISLTTNPFATLISAMTERVAVTAPVVLEPDGRVADTARSVITPQELFVRRTPFYRPPALPDWLAGMFLLFRSDAFAAVGGFDEGYFMYCEDFDICARLRLSGWRVARAARASVVHSAQQLSHRSLRHFRWHIFSLAKTWSSRAFWRYRTLLAAEASDRQEIDEAELVVQPSSSRETRHG